jgi:hypothetical protein
VRTTAFVFCVLMMTLLREPHRGGT